MSISSIAPPSLSTPFTAASAVGQENSLLHTQIGERTIKDRIDLSKEAVDLLIGGGSTSK